MAYTRNKRTSRSRNTSRRTTNSSKAADLVKLARQMGQVERGLKNPDSKISAAFNSGKQKPAAPKKRTLF